MDFLFCTREDQWFDVKEFSNRRTPLVEKGFVVDDYESGLTQTRDSHEQDDRFPGTAGTADNTTIPGYQRLNGFFLVASKLEFGIRFELDRIDFNGIVDEINFRFGIIEVGMEPTQDTTGNGENVSIQCIRFDLSRNVVCCKSHLLLLVEFGIVPSIFAFYVHHFVGG